MKKPKIHKVLLAICLALPITLTTNKETNATVNGQGKSNLPIVGNTINKGHNPPTYRVDTFYQILVEEIPDPKVFFQTDIREPLSDQQLIKILTRHIYSNINITKYLALLIQVNYQVLPIFFDKYDAILLDEQKIRTLLFDNQATERSIIANDDTTGQLANIIEDLRNISSKVAPKTQEKEILSLLFINPNYDLTKSNEPEPLRAKINAYKQDPKNTVDQSYSTLISFLATVAKQLFLENEQDYDGEKWTCLYKLSQLVSEFSDAYKNKLDKQKREKEEQERRQKEEERKNNNKNEQKTDNGEEQAGNIDINQIEQLIQAWKRQKEKINKDKEAKLKKLAHDIDSLEKKIQKIS